MLREDNADLRLTEAGRELGLVGDERWAAYCAKRERINSLRESLSRHQVMPGDSVALEIQQRCGEPISKPTDLLTLLRRPKITMSTLAGLLPELEPRMPQRIRSKSKSKYEGYIARAQEDIDRLKRHEDVRAARRLRLHVDFGTVDRAQAEADADAPGQPRACVPHSRGSHPRRCRYCSCTSESPRLRVTEAEELESGALALGVGPADASQIESLVRSSRLCCVVGTTRSISSRARIYRASLRAICSMRCRSCRSCSGGEYSTSGPARGFREFRWPSRDRSMRVHVARSQRTTYTFRSSGDARARVWGMSMPSVRRLR